MICGRCFLYKRTVFPSAMITFPFSHSFICSYFQKMSARVAGYAAIAFSVSSLFLVSTFVPALWNKINDITGELHYDMNEFRDLHNEVWANMRGETFGNSVVPFARKKRQTTRPGECGMS